jgi:hypothetical protein
VCLWGYRIVETKSFYKKVAIVAALISVCWGPWLLAYYWNARPDRWASVSPQRFVNKGTLLSEPRFIGLPDQPVWTILFLGQSDHESAEAQMQRVISALEKKSHRVQYRRQSLTGLKDEIAWLLVDPKGYAILSYPKEGAQQALLKDLKRLLYVEKQSA